MIKINLAKYHPDLVNELIWNYLSKYKRLEKLVDYFMKASATPLYDRVCGDKKLKGGQ